MPKLCRLAGDFANSENHKLYHVSINSNTRHSPDTRACLNYLLDYLIKNPQTTQEELREQLKTELKIPRPNVSRYLQYLREEIGKFGLDIDHPGRSTVQLRYKRQSRALVLIQGNGPAKPKRVLDQLWALDKHQEEIEGPFRILQAAPLSGQEDIFAIVEGPTCDSIFEFVLNEIDVLNDGIRTTTMLIDFKAGWQLFELPSSENSSKDAPDKDTPRKKTRKRPRR